VTTGGRTAPHVISLAALLAVLCALALPAPAALGDGSVDVNAGPATRIRHGLAASSANYTVLRVYAQAGDVIHGDPRRADL
jgi:hypothetical protein